ILYAHISTISSSLTIRKRSISNTWRPCAVSLRRLEFTLTQRSRSQGRYPAIQLLGYIVGGDGSTRTDDRIAAF
ncbi:hypothetical protein B0T21DRAFT_21327, partial [Apiosordaria backusii]